MSTHAISIEPVVINAPAQTVWDILIDIERYKEWNPLTVNAKSSMRVGDPITLYIATRQKDKVMKQQFVLEQIDAPHTLAWRLPKLIHKRLFSAYRVQTVEALDAARCSYSTTDTFTGWMAGRIYSSQHAWVAKNFDALAKALKARAESW